MAHGFEDDEGAGDEEGDEGGKAAEACAHGHADCRDEPDVRGGREADDVVFVMDEGSGAEEADAGDDLRRDAGAVGLASEEPICGEQGEEAGTYGNDHVRPDARRLPAPVALNANNEAEDCGDKDLCDVFRGKGPVHTREKYTLSLMKERIQKILSRRGIAARRKAEDFIRAGRVLVNGKIATIGQKADPTSDHIEVDGKPIAPQAEKIYYLMYKPVGVETTKKVAVDGACHTERDDTSIATVYDFLPPDLRTKVFPIGRLDKESEGLLLFTNDGELKYRLEHPSFDHEKEYEVETAEEMHDGALRKLEKGVVIDGTKTKPARIARCGRKMFRIALTEGRNRQIRRMCQKVGGAVVRLRRMRIMDLRDDRLRAGEGRMLTEKEQGMLGT